MQPDPATIELFRRELELCNVREGETVAVLSAGKSLRHYAETFLAAARRVLDSGVDAEFVIAGQGEDEVDLRRRADRLTRDMPTDSIGLVSCCSQSS